MDELKTHGEMCKLRSECAKLAEELRDTKQSLRVQSDGWKREQNKTLALMFSKYQSVYRVLHCSVHNRLFFVLLFPAERCYRAQICAILILLRCSFKRYPFLPIFTFLAENHGL